MTEMNQAILLRRRPVGAPNADDFEFVETAMPQPGEGQVLVRARFLSLDPYMRGRMSDAKSYSAPVALGAVMEGQTVGEVVASRAAGFAAGDGGAPPAGFCALVRLLRAPTRSLGTGDPLEALDVEWAARGGGGGAAGLLRFSVRGGRVRVPIEDILSEMSVGPLTAGIRGPKF